MKGFTLYALISGESTYYGYTVCNLNTVLSNYKIEYNSYLRKKVRFKCVFNIISKDEYYIKEINKYKCTFKEINKIKKEYISKDNNCVNNYVPPDANEGIDIEEINKKTREYRHKNRDRLNSKKRKYRQENKEHLAKYRKELYAKRRYEHNMKVRGYYLKDKKPDLCNVFFSEVNLLSRYI